MATIVVIDDDDVIRSLVSHKLTAAGHTVSTAQHGVSGLELVLSDKPDLVIIDWMMPGLTGLEVCRAIRNEPTTSDTHIIMLTARAQDVDLERGFNAGADGYITKPFSPRELTVRVDAALARKRA